MLLVDVFGEIEILGYSDGQYIVNEFYCFNWDLLVQCVVVVVEVMCIVLGFDESCMLVVGKVDIDLIVENVIIFLD